MMPEAAHLFIVVPRQHVGEMAHAETHFRAEGGGKKLARDLRRIHRLRRLETIVAIATSLRRVLAEVPEQHRAPAARGLDQSGERIQPLALDRTAFGLDLLLDALAGQREVLRGPE